MFANYDITGNKKQIKMKTRYPLTILFIIIVIGWLITSCSVQKRDQRRMNRKINQAEAIANKHGWKLQDTTVITDYDTIQEIKVNTVFETVKDTNGVKLIIDQYKTAIDSLTRSKIVTEVNKYIINKPILQDTQSRYYPDHDITVSIWQNQDGKLEVGIFKPESVEQENHEVVTDKILKTENKGLEWWHWVLLVFGGPMAAYIAVKVIRRV